MLCYLRHPGRPLHAGERPPAALLAFVAEQIDVLPESIDDYLAAERNRHRHAIEFQEQIWASSVWADAPPRNWRQPAAAARDRGRPARPFGRAGDGTCRHRRIVVPSPAALERLCVEVRHQARREVHRRLTNGLSADQRRRLDALTQRREETGQRLADLVAADAAGRQTRSPCSA